MNGKVYYIDFMQNEVKEGNMGVVRRDNRGLTCIIHLPKQFHDIKCTMHAISSQGVKTYLVDVYVTQGRGQARCDMDERVMDEWKSIWIQVTTKNYGICSLKKEDLSDKSSVENKQTRIEAAIGINNKEIVRKQQRVEEIKIMEERKKENEREKILAEKKEVQEAKDTFIECLPPMKTDKWEQLLQMYPQVHIFPEAETIVIKPKDMIVLTKEHQELATNSFVLHAYYNYRQLLLIRYQNKAQRQYYIGVPGIYYEREKRIAMLFGFEGFENGEARLAQASGKSTYTGCFGYYVKQVDI